MIRMESEEGQNEALWVRMQEGNRKRDLIVGIYYRPPHQGDELDLNSQVGSRRL